MHAKITLRFLLSLLCCLSLVPAGAMGGADVHADYARRYPSAASDPLAALQCTPGSAELEALTFLYAYMPAPDVAEHTPEFYLREVAATLRARREMPWGSRVPDREWRHFVLPLRVNNERLDAFRSTLYDTLRARVAGLSMEAAALEVNHWCHEHVSYRPSDSRTSSPLATLRAAIGRCGEESTFTVAALRTVGIPARQVYTPRWAHTDDNHAWVEVWIEGRWHFLGACEPEAVLDLGWFNAPASRGMLMHTKAFGRYDGSEPVMWSTACDTELNVTDHYAPTTATTVTVADASGRAVEGAEVSFRLYNYAEFFTVLRTRTDASGRASITTGRGDLVVWAHHGGKFGLAALRAGDAEARLVLDVDGRSRYRREFTLVPPPENARLPHVSPEAAAHNARRLRQEDSIRLAYVSTFADSARCDHWADSLGLPIAVRPGFRSLLTKSRGHWLVLLDLFARHRTTRPDALCALLSDLSEKDLRDVDPAIVDHHLLSLPPHTRPTVSAARYRLSPRMAHEPLSAWRGVADGLTAAQQAAVRRSPGRLAEIIDTLIAEETAYNPRALAQTPPATLRTRRGDALARRLLAVGMLRSLGILARIDPVTGRAQWSADVDSRAPEALTWTELPERARSADTTPPTARQPLSTARLRLNYSPTALHADPAYYTHFTLARIEGGEPVSLNYAETDTWSGRFAQGVDVPAGSYLLVSGTRMADGSVLVRAEGFPLAAADTVTVPLVLRHDGRGVPVIGTFDAELRYTPLSSAASPRGSSAPAPHRPQSLLATTGRGYYALALLRAGHEPSTHLLHDLEAVAPALEAWGRPILLLFASMEEWGHFLRVRNDFPHLPRTVHFGIDTTGAVAAALASAVPEACGPGGNPRPAAKQLPALVLADTFNRVLFRSQGYAIGLGEQLRATVQALQ